MAALWRTAAVALPASVAAVFFFGATTAHADPPRPSAANVAPKPRVSPARIPRKSTANPPRESPANHQGWPSAQPAPKPQAGPEARQRPGQAVADRYGAAVVVVRHGERRAHGFFVSSDGVLATVLPGARPGDRVTVGDLDEAGAVAVVDDDGLALVRVPTAADTPRAALAVANDDGAAGRWLVGLSRDERGGVEGTLGDVVERDDARWRVLLPLPRGAPVLNDRAVVVAVAARGHVAGVVEAVPSARLRQLAARLRPGVAAGATTAETPSAP